MVEQINPMLLIDGYKTGHKDQYDKDTQFVYSNFTPRKSRIKSANGIIFFGSGYFIKEYLIRRFNDYFFNQPKEQVVKEYVELMDAYLGKDAIDPKHIAELHDLGYLPLRIKALPEGTYVPCNIPVITIVNTNPKFYWLTNYLETLMSCVLWKASTSATTAFRYRRNFEKAAKKTGIASLYVLWQGHDFSFRGMSAVEDAMISGAAHLTSFNGTDTIPAIWFLIKYYDAKLGQETIGGSVPATEHSVMSLGSKEGETATFKRLITEVYPKGIVSIVSDTWDFWQVIGHTLPKLKQDILARDGKVVIRPDSGDPVKVICGDPNSDNPLIRKGAIECLWDIFGGAITTEGYKVLDSHIGLIYGDSITEKRQKAIIKGLIAKGFAPTNVLGIGSFTYQYVTRDTYGFAMKATWAQTASKGAVALFKDPKTDSGVKKSHRGLLSVRIDEQGNYYVMQNCTFEQEQGGELRVIFENGKPYNLSSLADIRARVNKNIAVKTLPKGYWK